MGGIEQAGGAGVNPSLFSFLFFFLSLLLLLLSLQCDECRQRWQCGRWCSAGGGRKRVEVCVAAGSAVWCACRCSAGAVNECRRVVVCVCAVVAQRVRQRRCVRGAVAQCVRMCYGMRGG